jgi:hypothetical protein
VSGLIAPGMGLAQDVDRFVHVSDVLQIL